MLGVEAIPAIVYALAVFTIPKSPRWLLAKGREDEARAIMLRIDPDGDFEEIIKEDSIERHKERKRETIFMRKYRFPLLLAFLIAAFNQFSGINAFLYYAPRIFEEAGLGSETALLSTIGIGLTNLVFTLLGVFLIDRLGRKQLMYMGSVGYIVSLGLVAAAFFFQWEGMAVPVFLFVFIASHAIGQGAVIWVFISEIFPNHLRADGQAFGSSTHWVLAAIIPSLVPLLFSTIGAGVVFLIFAVLMVFQLIWVAFMMPETKGVPLEELSKRLIKEESDE
jgi:sugar porter (SP) family MFS transporter